MLESIVAGVSSGVVVGLIFQAPGWIRRWRNRRPVFRLDQPAPVASGGQQIMELRVKFQRTATLNKPAFRFLAAEDGRAEVRERVVRVIQGPKWHWDFPATVTGDTAPWCLELEVVAPTPWSGFVRIEAADQHSNLWSDTQPVEFI